ncbi:MBL fold metallo-hydrolase [Candidatus Planktophila dulcis]|uniref:MBL fold metallo-hydrolase n=1 Tax=Candidatus Planktophila dulcis TaxID=1884914 RepID=UPI003CE9E112
MLVRSFPAPMFATNCWVIAPSEGSECIIVDPGMPDISRDIEMIIEEHKLRPVAALLTHGHLDHTFSITPLADGYDISAYIHSEDRRFIADPAGIHGEQFISQLQAITFVEPKKVSELKNGSTLELLGMKITAIHAPGHTRGSLMFTINDEILVSGDVLFAGSIGRTDLPTGSSKEMIHTLKTEVLTLSDDLRVLTGHGPETTIKFERKSNPYLKELTS